MRGKRITVLLLAVVLFSAVLPAQAACKHQWSGWEIAQEATDNAMGVRRRVCSKCGKTETKEYYPEGALYQSVRDRKADVREMQRRLIALGYLKDKADGVFGVKTKAAVARFQKAAGLAETGVAFPETLRRLSEEHLRLTNPGAITTPTPAPNAENAPDGEFVLRAVGATLQLLDGTREVGAKTDRLTFSRQGSVDFRVAYDSAAGKRIDYWVIDGVAYHFNNRVKSFTVRGLRQDMIIECVMDGKGSFTKPDAETVRQRRTGEPLLVKSINAKMCFLKSASLTSGAGGYFNEFDFTNDYKNRASNRQEEGGSVTLRVTASIPKGKKLSHWKFNDVRFYFGPATEYFKAEQIAACMTYEAVSGAAASTAAPTVAPSQMPPLKFYTVSCSGCTFSGSGYNGARSGKVIAGAKITVTADSTPGKWSGNMPFAVSNAQASFSFQVNQDYSISHSPTVN